MTTLNNNQQSIGEPGNSWFGKRLSFPGFSIQPMDNGNAGTQRNAHPFPNEADIDHLRQDTLKNDAS